MTTPAPDGKWLVDSLTAQIAVFRGFVQLRESTRAFALALKMLEFIEQDRESLWPSSGAIPERLSPREQIVIRSLKSLTRMMRRYDAENDQVDLLSVMMCECARLLLLFNGDGESDHPVTQAGMCYADEPEKRPKWPLAVKFGIAKFYFVRSLHSPGSNETKIDVPVDDTVLDYDQINVRHTGQAGGQWFDWEGYSIEHNMADIIHELTVNPQR